MGTVNKWLADQGEIPSWDWTKLHQQKEFISSPVQFTMFSGGFGTGKTAALCGKIVGLMTLVPGNLGYLARQDGKALRQTTMLSLLEMIPKEWIFRHDTQKGVLKFTPEAGGSMLIYGDLKDTGDLKNHNLGFFAIDQAEEMEWNSWEFLAGRLRRRVPILDPDTRMKQYWVDGMCPATHQRHFVVGSQNNICNLCHQETIEFNDTVDKETRLPLWDLLIYPRFGFGVCNTEDPGHWIYQRFGGLPGPREELSEGMEGYRAYSATTYDGLNSGFVDKSYVEALELTYRGNPLMFERYLLGKWVIAEGLVFPAFAKDVHLVHADEERYGGGPLLEDWLPVHEYIDPGISATTAIGWVVVENCKCGCEQPNYWLIDEHYVASPLPDYHCDQVKQHRQEIKRHVISTEMDEQAFSKSNIQKISESNESRIFSLAQLYIDQGVYVRRNQKDWDAGHARLSQALAPDPKHLHPVTGEPGAPHFFVFSKCKYFIAEIGNYKWKKRKGTGDTSEEPQDRDDHHMDGIISFMAGRPEHRVSEPSKPDTRPKHVIELEDELNELTGVGATLDFMEM